MARIRSVKPEFWEDETVGLLSPYARLLFIATWNFADDEGLLRWSAAYIKASVFMYDDLGVEQVAEVMGELTKSGLVFAYRAGKARQDLAYVINFRRHQKINRPQPGKLPPPPIQNRATWWMYAERDRWTCHLCGDEIARPGGMKDERVNLSLDHLIPRSKGGTDYPSNIAACHVRCNKQRGTKPLPDDVMEALTGSLTGSLNDSVNGSQDETLSPNESLPEQDTVGREGSREQGAGVPPSAGRTVAVLPTAQTLVAAYVDGYRGRAGHDPPSDVKGQLAKQLRKLLDDGVPYDTVKAGLVEWFDADTHPRTLASFVEVAGRGGRSRASPTRSQRQLDQARQTYQEMMADAPAGMGEHRRPPQPELARPADHHPDR